jgi:hypothetical protein
MVYCTGCRREYRPAGYSKHVQRTTNALCMAAHHKHIQDISQQDTVTEHNMEYAKDIDEPMIDAFSREGEVNEDTDGSDMDDDDDAEEVLDDEAHVDITEANQQVVDNTGGTNPAAGDNIYIEAFPHRSAGRPVKMQQQAESDYDIYQRRLAHINGQAKNMYYPFASEMDWDIAKWAKSHGTTSTAVTELLGIGGVSKGVSSHTHHLTSLY